MHFTLYLPPLEHLENTCRLVKISTEIAYLLPLASAYKAAFSIAKSLQTASSIGLLTSAINNVSDGSGDVIEVVVAEVERVQGTF